jgi:hypothetical protein
MGWGRRVGAIGAVLGLAACSTAHVDTGPNAGAEGVYASLFPYYAELCALSELKKKHGFGAEITSGVGGHAVFYLNGVCRDEGSHYPVIRLCDDATLPAERGVGISVNAHYKNANWIATPGREFFFHGGLAPGEPVTRAAYQRTQDRAKALGILDGIEFHDGVFEDAPPNMSRRDYQYDVSVATDYAIGFGRDRYCARVPLDRERMARIVDFMNALNVDYRNGKKEFDWDVLSNNCSHVWHNALSVAGVWSTWETGRFFLISAFDFPVPKNEFVNLVRRTNDMDIRDLDEIYDDDVARQALMRLDVLPTVPGAIAEAEPAVHSNEVYDTDLSLIFYDDPITGRYRRRFDRIFAGSRYTDLRANLNYFADLYAKIERERRPLESFLANQNGRSPTERNALASFYSRYYAYIERQDATVAAELTALPCAAAFGQGHCSGGGPAAPP